MTNELNTAFSLLGVGMITVFIVLSFVVIVGNILIKMVNRYVPIQEKKNGMEQISPSKIEAIKSAVDSLTGGKGEVIRIEKAHK